MANLFATKTGVWNDTTVWNTGTLPTSSDDVYANAFTVTINQNITVLSLRTTSASGINAGGGFTNSGSFNVTANLYPGTTQCMNHSGTGTMAFVGSVYGSVTASAYGLSNTGTGTINATGDATGGTANNTEAVRNVSSGIINWTGNFAGGSGAAAFGISNVAAGTITITGNVTGSGTISTAVGASNAGLGTMVINGSAIGGSSAIGASNTSTGSLTVTRAVGNSANVVAGVNGTLTNGTTVVEEIEFGATGATPVTGYIKFKNGTANKCLAIRQDTSQVTLINANSIAGELPVPANVRAGTTYNSGAKTGTLAVPIPANVRVGVATDNTVGTAALTASDIVAANQTAFPRMVNVATVQSTGDQIAAITP
ncbi:hypothetical protein [Spirosoma spitsbergense]|uniref:hypothetical protein n=1 Tax=Spirosoma spitsbergense TaxID=431554 RepID=UPI00037EA37E|nr:hypothetical protein [Spirosoma spitsbergense]